MHDNTDMYERFFPRRPHIHLEPGYLAGRMASVQWGTQLLAEYLRERAVADSYATTYTAEDFTQRYR
jgi:hypothetical protein